MAYYNGAEGKISAQLEIQPRSDFRSLIHFAPRLGTEAGARTARVPRSPRVQQQPRFYSVVDVQYLAPTVLPCVDTRGASVCMHVFACVPPLQIASLRGVQVTHTPNGNLTYWCNLS